MAGHLTFALKWEGVDLGVLAAAGRVIPAAELAEAIRSKPHGRYLRRVWFVLEWHFPSDEAAGKLLYLAPQNIGTKWRDHPATEWRLALPRLAILFGDRLPHTL